MKTCTVCKVPKEITEYHKKASAKTGLSASCKSCKKIVDKEYSIKHRKELNKKASEYYYQNKELCKSNRRKYYEKNKAYFKLRASIWKKNNRDKVNASTAKTPWVYSARLAAQSIKVPEGHQRHHWNYNKEYLKDIIPLLTEVHIKLHRLITLDKELLIYKTKWGGEFLDTKEKHLEFIKGFLNRNVWTFDPIPPLRA